MRITRTVLLVVATLLGAVAVAQATAVIDIDLSSQTMRVHSSSGSYTWAVSTARSGYTTPRGHFAPTGLQRMHYSKKYHMSPMPYSIFFRGGYAIHGTYSTGSLGSPASHGCVRLSPEHAAMLYRMVQNEGGSISISGSPGGSTRFAHHHRQTPSYEGGDSALAFAEGRRHRHHGSVRSWQRAPDSGDYGFFGGFGF